MRIGIALLGFMLFASVCHATNVVFSANAGVSIEGSPVSVQGGGLISFDTSDVASAHVPFDFPGNLDAVHVLDNGNYLVSYHSEVTIAGFTFDDDHIVEYDVESNVVSSFLDYAGIIDSAADSDIDAFFVLPNGNHVFSNATDAIVGGIEITANDLVEYNPGTGQASIYFDGGLIQDGDRFNNLSGASLFSEDVLALSVSTGGSPVITLGGQGFQRNEIVLYDRSTAVGSMLAGGDLISTPVDAIHIGTSATVPEPRSGFFVGWLATLFLARRSRNVLRVSK